MDCKKKNVQKMFLNIIPFFKESDNQKMIIRLILIWKFYYGCGRIRNCG